MDEPHGIKRTNKNILALSWNIATEPALYRKLSSNPYTSLALQIISHRFPYEHTTDVLYAIVMAEPEGQYDRNFKLLRAAQQTIELQKQKDTAESIQKRLMSCCTHYDTAFRHLPKEFVYDNLTRVVFETLDGREIEERFAQQQRRDVRTSIIQYIEDLSGRTAVPGKEKSADSLFTSLYAKLYGKRSVALAGFSALSFMLSFHLFYGIYTKAGEKRTLGIQKSSEPRAQILDRALPSKNQWFPVRLKIPRIQVDAAIVHVGLTAKGEMETPANTFDAGWFKHGPIPGELGSAVIAGHVDGEHGDTGVFAQLNKLRQGDTVYVQDEKGISLAFTVRGRRMYDPGYAEEVFSLNDTVRLNLVTCDGVWDTAKKSYSKRLVVFADSSIY